MTSLSPAARSVVLALADDEHMIGSHHANWIGLGPFLEEDLAFCSIAQDELGHALALYELLRPAADIDRFALLRDPADYRSCALAEIECATWDLALVRHWLYDTAERFRWENLTDSSQVALAELAGQALRDEAFHRSHAEMFMSRMSSDPDAVERIRSAWQAVAPLASSMWVAAEDEQDALTEGVIRQPSNELEALWVEAVIADLNRFGLDLEPSLLHTEPTPRTTRSDGFQQFHSSLGEVISLDPTAIW